MRTPLPALPPSHLFSKTVLMHPGRSTRATFLFQRPLNAETSGASAQRQARWGVTSRRCSPPSTIPAKTNSKKRKKRRQKRGRKKREKEKTRRRNIFPKKSQNSKNPPDELSHHDSKQNPAGINHSVVCSSKVQNLTHFSINSMIRIRFSGCQELIWKGFPRARYTREANKPLGTAGDRQWGEGFDGGRSGGDRDMNSGSGGERDMQSRSGSEPETKCRALRSARSETQSWR